MTDDNTDETVEATPEIVAAIGGFNRQSNQDPKVGDEIELSRLDSLIEEVETIGALLRYAHPERQVRALELQAIEDYMSGYRQSLLEMGESVDGPLTDFLREPVRDRDGERGDDPRKSE